MYSFRPLPAGRTRTRSLQQERQFLQPMTSLRPSWSCLAFAAKQGYCGNTVSQDATVFDVHLLLPHGERWIQVGCQEHIWDAAFAAGITLPALCHQGRCLTCAGRLENDGEVDQSDSVSYFPEDQQGGFLLLCTGKPRTSLRIRTHQANEMRNIEGKETFLRRTPSYVNNLGERFCEVGVSACVEISEDLQTLCGESGLTPTKLRGSSLFNTDAAHF